MRGFFYVAVEDCIVQRIGVVERNMSSQLGRTALQGFVIFAVLYSSSSLVALVTVASWRVSRRVSRRVTRRTAVSSRLTGSGNVRRGRRGGRVGRERICSAVKMMAAAGGGGGGGNVEKSGRRLIASGRFGSVHRWGKDNFTNDISGHLHQNSHN